MKYHSIILKLANIPHVWSLNSKIISIESIRALNRFIIEEAKNNQFRLKDNTSIWSDSINISYHQSLFHFFLYYTYYPKIPFVIMNDDCLFFGSFYGRNHRSMELSIPFIYDHNSILHKLDVLLNHSSFADLLKENRIKQILLRDIPEMLVSDLRNSTDSVSFQLHSLKEILYRTYDVNKTIQKTGKEFANLRWHLNKFKKDNHTIARFTLSEQVKPVIHLIGSWKKMAIKHRGFSYINVHSDKHAARLFGKDLDMNNANDLLIHRSLRFTDCISQVLSVDGKIASFNFGYPLGIFEKQSVFAHAIGITDVSIPHLAEYAQYEFWKEIQKNGYLFINDGPSWKSSLETYKKKFGPVYKKRYYYATITI
jgi:hypothetical protein